MLFCNQINIHLKLSSNSDGMFVYFESFINMWDFTIKNTNRFPQMNQNFRFVYVSINDWSILPCLNSQSSVVMIPKQNSSLSFAVRSLDKVGPFQSGQTKKIFVEKFGRTQTCQSFLQSALSTFRLFVAIKL